MDNQVHNQIVSFIWGIADDCLRDVYVRGKYRDVILPMTVIRRLDAMLEETKPAVLAMKKQLDAAKIDNQWPALCNAAGQAFCNASPFLLKDLTSRAKAQTLKADFIAYLDGFSPNVQVILDKFKFRNKIDTMVDADILGAVIEKFTSCMAPRFLTTNTHPVSLTSCFQIPLMARAGKLTQKKWVAKRKSSTHASTPIWKMVKSCR